MQTNKLQTNYNKTLMLTNVLMLSIKAEDLQNFARTVELMQNYIKSKGALLLGPLVQYSSIQYYNDGAADIKINLLQQTNIFIYEVEPPYSMESIIRVPDCLYVRYTGSEERLQFAYDKLNLIAFEEDISLVGDNYTVFLDKNDDILTADVFMEKRKDE
jgi:hypothetical protein